MPGPLDPALPSPLPPILAGPIVRRLTRNRVYIWVATSVPDPITLLIRQQGAGAAGEVAFSRSPIQVGTSLWIALIEATGIDGGVFQANQTYEYRLTIPNWNPGSQYWSDLALAAGPNDNPQRPSFVGLSANVGGFRLIHTSCRKMHGGGRDSLSLLSQIIEAGDFPDTGQSLRPHMMVLSGDQIYADDVPSAITPAIRKIATEIIGIDESLFDLELKVNGREQACLNMGLTAGDVAHDHLWTFGEFCAMYLLAWSPLLWPSQGDGLLTWDQIASGLSPGDVSDQVHLPSLDCGGDTPGTAAECLQNLEQMSEEVLKEQPDELREAFLGFRENWDKQSRNVEAFAETVADVRKLLANVPTLMIFDDHEVTDDWNLNWNWAKAVYEPGLPGQRLITNGLLSYFLFQHWGNVPESTPETLPASPTPNEQACVSIFSDIQVQGRTHPVDRNAQLLTDLGVPTIPSNASPPTETNPVLTRDLTSGIRYDYRIDAHTAANNNGIPFRLFAFDGRTAREFTGEHVLSSRPPIAAIDEQIPDPATLGVQTVVATVVVMPSPLLGEHLLEHYLQPTIGVFDFGLEPSGAAFVDLDSPWAAFGPSLPHVLERLALFTRAVVLSGDVHFGFTRRMEFWRPPPPEQNRTNGVFAQLTCSSQRNADFKTALLHTHGDALQQLGLIRTRAYLGFEPSLTPQQRALLVVPPEPPVGVPWDEAVDIWTGRILRNGFEEPAVIPETVANAYGLGGGAFRYQIDHIDDETFADTPDGAIADAVNGTPWRDWDTDDPERAAAMVKALNRSDLARIGRSLFGLPQVALITMNAPQDPIMTSVDHRVWVALGEERSDPPDFYRVDTTVSFV